MIDRALAGLNASQQDTYYFQLYPLNLTIVGKESVAPPSGTTYRFTVSKGNCILIKENRNSMKLNYRLKLILKRLMILK